VKGGERCAAVARRVVPTIVVFLGASGVEAQAPADSARCDSIVGSSAAVVDSVPTAMFLSVTEAWTNLMTVDQRDVITSRIAFFFAPPSPFPLSVFEGPALVRGLRISAPGDSVGVPRAASVYGTYRIEVTDRGSTDGPQVIRSSLLRGFDLALINAIASAAKVGTAFRPVSGDRWRLFIRVTEDSLDGARRLAQGTFPRMRVHDAVSSPPQRLTFPEQAIADGFDHGEVVFRFVVDRDGHAALETVEIVRSTAPSFVRAAFAALADQRFTAATIRGCPVAQLIELPFIFDAPQRPPPLSR
jgi:hypothetical protein